MKFSSGQWVEREDVSLVFPVGILETQTEDGRLAIHCPTKEIKHRGETIFQATLTYELSAPIEHVIRVRLFRHKGGVPKTPSFDLAVDPGVTPVIEDNDDAVVFASGGLTARFAKKGEWRLDFSCRDRPLTASGLKHAAHITTGHGRGEVFMREQLSLSVGECVYGLGERFTPFVKNGQSVDIWNEDGGTGSERAYKNIPFYLTNRGYGVFVNHPERVSFEIASEKVDRVQWSVPGEELEYFIIGGETLKDVISNYTALTGRPALPPAWSFGLWLSSSFCTDYDEKTVTGFLDAMREREIPVSVFHFDCFWMKAMHWTDLLWDHDLFPDPAGMLKRLKARGLRVCLWINPYIAQLSRLFDEGKKHGYLVKRPDGSLWQADQWQAGMALVDFTNPAAVAWFQGHITKLLAQGVDSLKTDFGEIIPTDVVWHDGSDQERMHNYYTFLYNQAVFAVLEKTQGRGQAVLFARSATAGCQRFPLHWGGDCVARYSSMAETLRGGLSLGLSGFGFWSHDIGGFVYTATPDLYKRWTAFGLLSSHSRLHGNDSYRVPWNFDEEASTVLKHFSRLKNSLMPYLWAAAVEASRTGVPVLRAMVLEFQDDPACRFLDCQYMLGPDLLVAPVFSADGTVSFYLPAGRWTHFLTGESLEGGRWFTRQHDYFSLPLWVRPNRLIPVGAAADRPDYDYGENVTFHFFHLDDGVSSAGTVFDEQGNAALEVSVSRERETVRLSGPAGKAWTVLVRAPGGVNKIPAGKGEKSPAGLLITPVGGKAEFVVSH